MKRRSAARALAISLVVVAGLIGPAAAQQPAGGSPAARSRYTPPRTAWGDPDLRGMWPLEVGLTPMQRPVRFGDRAQLDDEEYQAALKRAADVAKGADREQAANKLGAALWSERGNVLRQTSLITEPANGRIPPLTELGKARAAAMKSTWSTKVFDDISDFNSLDRCITRGLTSSMIPFPYNNGLEIFQSPGYVAIRLEIVHETRIIPLGNAPKLPRSMETWLGSSRGHFEGNTLVIETTNFNGRSPMIIVGPTDERVPTSKAMHVVEHLTPTGPNTIYYEAWVEDPEDLTGPWKMEFPWTRNSSYKIYEYACHEGNTALRGYIRATSPRFAEQRKAATGR